MSIYVASTGIASTAAFQQNLLPQQVVRCSDRRRKSNYLRKPPFPLFGIDEWREASFIAAGDAGEYGVVDMEDVNNREVCVLPFPYQDIVLQGQTKQVRLYEDRFIKLFEKCQEEHNGVVCMGLMTDTGGIVQTSALCEVEDYNRSKEFGIFATLRVMGRVKLTNLTQMEPFIVGQCTEFADDIPKSLDLPNMVADGIDNLLSEVSCLEVRLLQAQDYADEQKKKSNKSDDNASSEMKERIVKAAFDDQFYVDSESNTSFSSRKSHYTEAYNDALACDTQGFVVSNKAVTGTTERSAKELTAISWAVFCADDVKASDKVQALDCDKLFDRLKLAAHTLREKTNMINAKLAIAGLSSEVYGGDEDEYEESEEA